MLSPLGTSRTSGQGVVPSLTVRWLCHQERRGRAGRARLQHAPGSAAAAPTQPGLAVSSSCGTALEMDPRAGESSPYRAEWGDVLWHGQWLGNLSAVCGAGARLLLWLSSSSASWRHLPGMWGRLLPRVSGQGESPTHSAGLGLGTKPSSSHQQQAWGEGGFGSRLIQGGCCTMLLLSRGSCCVSHSCGRLPDLTHATLG